MFAVRKIKTSYARKTILVTSINIADLSFIVVKPNYNTLTLKDQIWMV